MALFHIPSMSLPREQHPGDELRTTRGTLPGPVVVNDCSGHPFQIQLSRWLAAQGIPTTHLYCPSIETAKGNLDPGPGPEHSLKVRSVPMGRPFAKYSPVRRLAQEALLGMRLARAVRRERPQMVLSANTPLLAATVLQLMMSVARIPVVFWLQDVYSVAISMHFRARHGRLGVIPARVLTMLERWAIRSSSAVVSITDDFVPLLVEWGVDSRRIHVIENWAPLDELPPKPRHNTFARDHGLEDLFVFLYAGTLGLKHDPTLLADLARHYLDRPDVKVVVASQGPGADWLARHAVELPNLLLLPYQPYGLLPDLLASGDVLITVLEPEAGIYSVPSKVLTYHCAGRPILASVPAHNLAARIIEREGSGLCVPAGDRSALTAAADRLVSDPDLRAALAERARHYAEATFDIDRIGPRFRQVLAEAGEPRSPRRAAHPCDRSTNRAIDRM